MGSILMANGKECLDGWVRAGRGELMGGGVEFGVSRSLLGEIPREIIGDKVGEECGGEEFGFDGGVVMTQRVVLQTSLNLSASDEVFKFSSLL
ncbi:hypothetical protein Tco_0994766, partial [Tanacetum coccineum]